MDEGRTYRLRFFFEWGAPAYLWAGDDYTRDAFGVGPLQETLSLSETTLKRGEELSDWYQNALNWESPSDPGLWRQEECDRFRAAARAFFQDLQSELGDAYELLYQQHEPDEDPDLEAYWQDPRHFRRRKTD